MPKNLRVFREFTLHGPNEKRSELCAKLVASTSKPWKVDLTRSINTAAANSEFGKALFFHREKGDHFPASELILWNDANGLHCRNIAPREIGSLDFSQFNEILEDFLRWAKPIAEQFNYEVETTESQQSIEDWITKDTAEKLRRFSGAANKSTRATHPLDQERWFDFVIASYLAGDVLDVELLARWLHEGEGWDSNSAHILAQDYEIFVALLEHFDSYKNFHTTGTT